MKPKLKPKAKRQEQGPDAALALKILRAIRGGADLSLASKHAGLDPAVLALWLRSEGPAWERFRKRVRVALSSPELAALRSALAGARRDPKVALEYLRTRYFAKYDSRPQVVQQFNFGEMMRKAVGEGEQARAAIQDGAGAEGEIPGGAGGETAAPGEEPAP